jgi:hypothetical protein
MSLTNPLTGTWDPRRGIPAGRLCGKDGTRRALTGQGAPIAHEESKVLARQVPASESMLMCAEWSMATKRRRSRCRAHEMDAHRHVALAKRQKREKAMLEHVVGLRLCVTMAFPTRASHDGLSTGYSACRAHLSDASLARPEASVESSCMKHAV